MTSPSWSEGEAVSCMLKYVERRQWLKTAEAAERAYWEYQAKRQSKDQLEDSSGVSLPKESPAEDLVKEQPEDSKETKEIYHQETDDRVPSILPEGNSSQFTSMSSIDYDEKDDRKDPKGDAEENSIRDKESCHLSSVDGSFIEEEALQPVEIFDKSSSVIESGVLSTVEQCIDNSDRTEDSRCVQGDSTQHLTVARSDVITPNESNHLFNGQSVSEGEPRQVDTGQSMLHVPPTNEDMTSSGDCGITSSENGPSVEFASLEAGCIHKVEGSPPEGSTVSSEGQILSSSQAEEGKLVENRDTEKSDKATQTKLELKHSSEENCTQTNIVYEECCKCGVFALPVDVQVGNKLREEISQRMTLENLVKIIEREVVGLRQEVMVQTGKAAKLENTIFDLKAEIRSEQQISAKYKMKSEEIEESLEGSRNMILKLEDQLAKTNYFKSGVDYMLEAKLSESKAAEAQTKVEILQEELLQAKQETHRLLERLSEANRERKEMVSGSVHMELLRIADERTKEAEFKVLQLENELRTLKSQRQNGQDSFDPHENSHTLAYSTRSFHATDVLKGHPFKPPGSAFGTKDQRENLAKRATNKPVKNTKTLPQPAASQGSGAQLELPEVGSFGPKSNTGSSQVPSIVVSFDKPLMVGTDSDSSDWSDSDSVSTSPSKARLFFQRQDQKDQKDHPVAAQPKIIKPVISKPKPPLPQKPRIAPKPRLRQMENTNTLEKTVSFESTSESTSESMEQEEKGASFENTFDSTEQEEKGVSFEETVHSSPLGKFSRTKGPEGRRRPQRLSHM
ncbi:uncharacterized protein LOC106152942 [Lingula anatina]|uniref:Uncharacterized protein LOC106152942 n=1 Tax=Lingula anatina TaxID=7574 RepID=A0A1S3H818_LINAN|nr:uncharacterized protein LOC106152942 [Lingula anatina]|eukprot:XP_013382143.1 uncharacterized protein LOC106152942 [Lingula anatina]